MPDELSQPPGPKEETDPALKDLRAGLAADLKSKFSANLSAAGTLPKVACDSLVTLLGVSGPTSAEVVAALALEDTTQPEVPNE